MQGTNDSTLRILSFPQAPLDFDITDPKNKKPRFPRLFMINTFGLPYCTGIK